MIPDRDDPAMDRLLDQFSESEVNHLLPALQAFLEGIATLGTSSYQNQAWLAFCNYCQFRGTPEPEQIIRRVLELEALSLSRSDSVPPLVAAFLGELRATSKRLFSNRARHQENSPWRREGWQNEGPFYFPQKSTHGPADDVVPRLINSVAGIIYRTGVLTPEAGGGRRVHSTLNVTGYQVVADPEELVQGHTYRVESAILSATLDAMALEGKHRNIHAIRERLKQMILGIRRSYNRKGSSWIFYCDNSGEVITFDDSVPMAAMMSGRIGREIGDGHLELMETVDLDPPMMDGSFQRAIHERGVMPFYFERDTAGSAAWSQTEVTTFCLEDGIITRRAFQPSRLMDNPCALAVWQYPFKKPVLKAPLARNFPIEVIRTLWAGSISDGLIIGRVLDGGRRQRH